MTDALSGEGVEKLIENIQNHKEHLELSELLNEKKQNRFTYKIQQLLLYKMEKIVFGELVKEGEIEDFVKNALNDGKFKIYESIHNKFENIKFELKKE